MTMWIIWIAIACITVYWAHREYGEMLKVKTQRHPADDKGRRLKALRYMSANARRSVTIIDYRSHIDDSLYENADVARMIRWALQRNPELRIEIATAHSADCWLLQQTAEAPRITAQPGGLAASGQALVMLMDRGALAYVVNSWGRVKQYDCREVGRNARELTLGAQIGAADELFPEDQRPPRDRPLLEGEPTRTGEATEGEAGQPAYSAGARRSRASAALPKKR